MNILTWLRSHIKTAFDLAHRNGLDDELIDLALKWVKVAAQQFETNEQRREFVVKILVARGVPESVARLAVEMAIQLLKRELANA